MQEISNKCVVMPQIADIVVDMGKNTTQTPIEVIKSVIRKDSDNTLVALAKASTNQPQEPKVHAVQFAIIEVLCERHPRIFDALDEWELDLDGDRSQMQVVIDCMEVK